MGQNGGQFDYFGEYLQEKHLKMFNILKYVDFVRSLEETGDLQKEEKGKCPNTSTFLTENDEISLWDVGKLGCWKARM